MALILAAAILIAFIALLGAFGMSGFLHRESAAYVPPDPSRLMSPLAAPLCLRKGRGKAVLFLHGYPATPFAFREPCAWAEEAGYDAFAPLLPGCGTRPKDFTKTNFAQLAAFARDEYRSLRANYREFHIVGSSMGGSLALGLAEEFCGTDLEPTSVSTVGCPVSLFSPFEGIWTYPHAPFARALGWFTPSVGARLPDPGRRGEDGSERWLGYVGIFPRQTHSLILFLRSVRKRLGSIDCPILIMHCRTDRTVDFRNQAIIARSIGSAAIRAYVANMDGASHSRHDLFLFDSTRKRTWNEVLRHIEASGEGFRGKQRLDPFSLGDGAEVPTRHR
jgi:carboxylesterase